MKKFDPQKQLATLIDKTRRAGQNLFTFTMPEPSFVTREKGQYAYLIVKASKRLASALAVDRELLILISPFEEQQQRTIKTAREMISMYGGRLESALAIIVHNDKEGNAKLQKWGRSAGLAILPIYAGRMPSDAEELESHLCHELFSHDPFDVTGPVSDDDNFFGRRNEALDLARKLQSGQVRSCLGIRKIGKTSVLNRIIGESRRLHDCYCVMMDCSRDQIWSQESSGLMLALADAVQAAKAHADRYATVAAPNLLADIGYASSVLLENITTAEKPVLIFIDEVDYITPGSPTAAHWNEHFNMFWRNFRAVYQEALRRNKHVSVMVGGVSSKWFSVGSIGGVENAALAFIPEEYLCPLPRGASNAMIKKMARSAGLTFTDTTADIISAACSDMPFWVRKACSFIHRHVDISVRPVELKAPVVHKLTADFITQEGATLAQVALSHLFRVYPELEACGLSCLSRSDSGPDTSSVTILRKYGVFAAANPIRPSGEMVEQALQLYKEQRDAAETSAQVPLAIALDVKDKKALDDWADDLAVISKGRNMLEKKLRQLVLNFIRADALARKKRGTTKDRIIAAVASERRNKINHLAADELMENLMWSELVGLINREWTLVGTVFGDRKQFEQHANIVNDRFDAHAKDVDELDLANYRRSVKWLSDRLVTI